MSNTLHQLKRAKEIVERYRARGNVLPRELRDCGRGHPDTQQEYRDACKVKTWKYSLLGKNIYNCADEVKEYLDENMPGWRDRVYSHQGHSSSTQMQKAIDIVKRYRERGCVLPRRLKDPTKAQETRDAINISTWKSSLKGYNRVTCSKELRAYLDENMPGWRKDHHKSRPRLSCAQENVEDVAEYESVTCDFNKKEVSTEKLMPIARGIVERFHANNKQYPSLKLVCRNDPSRAQEYADAKQLHSWKSHTDKTLAPEVFQFLDEKMPLWQKSHVSQTIKNVPMSKAREIFKRCAMRNGALPRLSTCAQTEPDLILEHKDALKLRSWKIEFLENPSGLCPALIAYLDEKLAAWRDIDITSPVLYDSMKEQSSQNRPTNNEVNRNGKRNRPSTSSPNKKENSSPCSNGTDVELSTEGSSNDGSSIASDEDFNQRQFLNQNKKKKVEAAKSFQTIDSEESAGIAALLQLSSHEKHGNAGVVTGTKEVPLSRPETSANVATVILPLPIPVPSPVPTPMSNPIKSSAPTDVAIPRLLSGSFSTYGHGGNNFHQQTITSLYSPLNSQVSNMPHGLANRRL